MKHRRRPVNPFGPGRSIYRAGTGWMAYMRPSHGVMRRHRCATYDEARLWLDAQEKDLPPLTHAQYAEAQSACSLLPQGVSLVEAARAWLASVRTAESVSMEEALRVFKEERSAFLRPSTVTFYMSVLTRFAASAGVDRMVSGIRPEDVSAFVADAKPSTRNALLRHLGGFFSWSVKRGWALENPCKKVEMARNVEAPRGVLSPKEAASLLHAAEKCAPGVVAPLAIQLFAGVRPAEIVRLPDDAVANGYVTLAGAVTKTADARTVPIRDNLSAWLAAYPYRKVSPSVLRNGTEKARKAAGLADWPKDCLRHSFATYAYERDKNAAAVAADMGHAGTDVFFRHYRALAKPGDGKEFFALLPCAKSVQKVSQNGSNGPKRPNAPKAKRMKKP
ncbi:MAG: hypothetical protein IJS32_09285 [Kiritimatiellae bacterium]|nr:hypothetical protein [Kiritimatiellia bacterium]